MIEKFAKSRVKRRSWGSRWK